MWTARDYHTAAEAVHWRGTSVQQMTLFQHNPHANHCGGYDVLAWPCPTAAKILDDLFGGAE